MESILEIKHHTRLLQQSPEEKENTHFNLPCQVRREEREEMREI